MKVDMITENTTHIIVRDKFLSYLKNLDCTINI